MKNLGVAFKTYSDSQKAEREDSFYYRDNLFIVAEGVGGEYVNNIAQELACSVISDSFFKHLSENQSPGNALTFALEQANMSILKEKEKLGEKMAASVSVVYIRDKIMYFAHLGDARIYSLYGDEIDQLTRDHTLLEEDPYSNRKYGDPRLMAALTNGLGIHSRPDIAVKKYPIPKKGFIIMTTEGLTRRISNREILRVSMKSRKPETLRDSLINLALKKGGSINGNVTVGIIRFGGIPKEIRKIIFTYSVFFLMVVILIAGYLLKYGSDGDEVKAVDKTSQPAIQEEIKENPEEVSQTVTEKKPVNNNQSVTDSQEKKVIEKNHENDDFSYVDNAKLFDRIFSLIGEWKTAWELSAGIDGDIDKYLSFYSDEFKAGRFDKKAWQQDKALKNRKKKWIKIEISDIRILSPDDNNRIEVRFLQDYTSSNYSSKGNKVIILSREGNEWKIIMEKGY